MKYILQYFNQSKGPAKFAIIIAFIMLADVKSSTCASVNQAQAEAVVRGWLISESPAIQANLGKTIAQVEEFDDSLGSAIYYVVNLNPEGYVIVPADDLIEPILAFSSTGFYIADPNNPLCALIGRDVVQRRANIRRVMALNASGVSGVATKERIKWEKLSNKSETRIKAYAARLAKVSDIRVPAIIKSAWSQTTVDNSIGGNSCYNYYTPPYGSDSPSNYPTGCTVTATAQLLRHWQFPTSSVGTKSFQITVDGIVQDVNLRGGDGLGGAYDWANMVLAPNGSTSIIQRKAIGALCKDVGVATAVDYSASASRTSLYNARQAMCGTFNYANAMYGYPENSATFYNMVNPNLDAGYPVLLGLSGPKDGHSVICDGYGYNLSTIYHHLNPARQSLRPGEM